MKAAFVVQPYDNIFPPTQNSIGLIAYNTAIEMGRQIDLTLYGKRKSGIEAQNDLPFRISFVSGRVDDILQYVATHYPRWASRLGISTIADAYPGYVRSIAKELNRSNYDIVHVMNYWSWCRQLSGQARDRRIVLEMQAEWLSQMDESKVQVELEAVDAVVAVSDHIAKLFRASFPRYRGQVATAYNGVDLDTFSPAAADQARDADAINVLFVGRVSPEKGIHTLIEAFAKVAAAEPRARLQIVGGRATLRPDFIVTLSADPLVRALERFYGGSECDDYQTYLDALVRKLNLEDKVRFVGKVAHKELPAWYRAATVVVNPSLSESFGISIVEGMACGIPVVGTKVGGMLETIVDGETGRSVDAERPDLLADALLEVLGSPEKADTMGRHGRQRAVERFSWRARADRLIATYRAIGA